MKLKNPFHRFVRQSSSLTATMVLCHFAPNVFATTYVWDGNGTGATNLNIANNWNPNTVPAATAGDVGQFNGTVAGDLTLSTSGGSAGTNPWSISVTSTQASSLTIDPPTSSTNFIRIFNITIDSGAFGNAGAAFSLGNGTGTPTVNLGNADPLYANNTFTNNCASTAAIQSDIRFGSGSTVSRTLTFDGSGNWNVTAPLGITISGGTGSLAVSKNGSGALTLNGANTFTDGFAMSQGTLNLNTTTALGAAASTFTISGGTIDNTSASAKTNANNNPLTLNGDFAYSTGAGTSSNDLSLGTGAVSLGSAAGTSRTITTNGGGLLTIGGAVSNGATANSIIKTGAGGLKLDGSNAYTGGTTLSAGQLHVGNNSALGTGTVTVNGGLMVARNASRTISNAITAGADFGIGLATAGNQMNFSGTVSLGGGTRTITVADSTQTLDSTISGVISNGGLTKSGSGTLVLSAANTFSGPTSVTQGLLTLNNANPLDSSSSVTINGSGAKLIVSGGGFLPQSVTLTQGAIDGNGTLSSLTVADSIGNIVSAGNSAFTALTIGSLNFQGAASLNLTSNGPFSGQELLVTDLTTSASADVVVNVTSSSNVWLDNTDYYLIEFTNYASAADASHFTLTSPPGLNPSQHASLVNTGGAIILRITADSLKWTGAQSSDWTTVPVGGSKNWTDGATPVEYTNGRSVLFDDETSAVRSINIAENVSPSSVILKTTSDNFTLSSAGGFGIAGSGSLTKDGAVKATIATNNTYTGTTTINGGILEVTGSIASSSSIVDNAALVFDLATTPNVYANTISGSGSVTKNGNGALTLSGANTFAGNVTLNAGTLNFNGPSALGAASGLLVINGGTLDNNSGSAVVATANKPQTWNADFTFTGSNDLDMGTGTVTLGGSGDRTVSVGGAADILSVGEIKSSSQGLTISGGGTLVATSIGGSTSGSSITGTLNVGSGATLQINRGTGNTSATTGDFVATGLAGSGTITNGAALTDRLLQINTSGNDTFSGTLANGGVAALGLTKLGSGTLSLTGANSYTGATTLSAGTLILSGSGSATSGITMAADTTLTVTNPAASGAGAITSSGSGSRTVNFHINGGGTLANHMVASSGHVVTIDVDRNDGASTNGVIRLTGTPLSGGNATYHITGANGYSLTLDNLRETGGSDGTITLDPTTANLSLGSFSGVAGTPHSYVLGLSGTSSGNAVTGIISNGTATSISVTKSGSSSWTLMGANTYTGVTTISEGTLQLGNGTTDGTIANTSSVVNNATLVYNWATNHTANYVISGNGAVTKNGAGTASLSGVNTYTGVTTVNAGELAVNGTSIADANTVVINGGKVNLTGTEIVDKLYFGGVQQPAGSYTMANDGTHFSGSGTLFVSSGPATGFATWKTANGATGQTASDDHDKDGVANGVEFFVGGGTGFTAMPPVVTDAGVRTVTWPKSASFSGTYQVQVSSDLSNWSAAPGGSVTDNGTSVVFTFPAGPSIRFVRLVVNPS